MTAKPELAGMKGLLFVLPFAVLNAIVATRFEPFFSLIRPGPHTSGQEMVLLACTLLMMPFGAFVALRPVLRRGEDGRRRFVLFNTVAATLLLLNFAALAIGLGSEIYRCEILRIPNCD